MLSIQSLWLAYGILTYGGSKHSWFYKILNKQNRNGLHPVHVFLLCDSTRSLISTQSCTLYTSTCLLPNFPFSTEFLPQYLNTIVWLSRSILSISITCDSWTCEYSKHFWFYKISYKWNKNIQLPQHVCSLCDRTHL